MEPRAGPLLLTTEEAAKLLGVGKPLFLRLASEFTRDWMRPLYLPPTGRKRVKMWDRDDVLCLAHIYRRRLTAPPEAPRRRGGPQNS